MKNDPFHYLSYVLKVYRSVLLVSEYCHTLVETSCRCEYNPHDWLSEAFVSVWMSFNVISHNAHFIK